MAGELTPYTGDQPYRDFANNLRDAAFAVVGFTAVVNAAARELADAVAALKQAGAQGGAGGGGLPGKGKRPGKGKAPLRRGQVYGQAAGAGLKAAGKAFLGGAGAGGAAKAGLAAAGGALTVGGAATAAAFTGVIAAAGALAAQFDKLAAEQQRYMQQLAQFSAPMAQVQAERNLQEIQRQREFGDRLSESARNLAQAEQRYKDETKEINILVNSVKNEMLAEWDNFKTGFMRTLNKIAGALNKILNIAEEPETKDLLMGDWAQKLADEDRKWRDENFGRRNWEPAGSDRGVPGAAFGGGGAFDD